MGGYIARRIVLLVPTLIISSLLVFIIIRAIPGSAVDVLMSRMDLSGGFTIEQREALEKELGLDKPIWRQYGEWMISSSHFDSTDRNTGGF